MRQHKGISLLQGFDACLFIFPPVPASVGQLFRIHHFAWFICNEKTLFGHNYPFELFRCDKISIRIFIFSPIKI